ncbi:hypothetical protein ACVW0Y_003575 [Pseudomonas sp. TE3786]
MGLIRRWLFALCQSRSGQVLKQDANLVGAASAAMLLKDKKHRG